MGTQNIASSILTPNLGFRFVSDAQGVQVVLMDRQGQAVSQFRVLPVLDFSGGKLDVRA